MYYTRENQSRFLALGGDHGDPNLMTKTFQVCYERAYPLLAQNLLSMEENEKQMLYHFLSHGAGAVLTQWIKNGMGEDPENVAQLILTLIAISATAIGIGYIPGEALNIGIMDYQIYKTGKDRSALCNATAKFLDKAQNAVSSGMVGIILVAVGYVVDSVTGDYAGELAKIPSMLNWFIVIMGLAPCILGVIALVIFRKYPIPPELAAEMKEKLDEHHAAQNQQ